MRAFFISPQMISHKPFINKVLVDIVFRCLNLWEQYFSAGDGTSDKEWEKGKVEGIIYQFCRLRIASLIDVNGVTDSLKGEE